MQNSRIACTLTAILALTAATPRLLAQRDVSIESLVRLAEGRIGVHGLSLRTGEEIALNADASYPLGTIRVLPHAELALLGATGATDSRPSRTTAAMLAADPLRDLTTAISAPDRANAPGGLAFLDRDPFQSGLAGAAMRGFDGLLAASSPGRGATGSPRALSLAMARLLRSDSGQRDGALRRMLVAAPRTRFGAFIPPQIETGSIDTGLADAPGTCGYVRFQRGDVIVTVMTSGFRSGALVATVVPTIVAGVARRLGAGLPDPPDAVALDTRALGVIGASLHEVTRDADLFVPSGSASPTPHALRSDEIDPITTRRGRQTLSFKTGETARVAAVVRALDATRVTVQWVLPGKEDRRHAQQALFERGVPAAAEFDLPLEEAGAHEVRVFAEGSQILHETFFVTRR